MPPSVSPARLGGVLLTELAEHVPDAGGVARDPDAAAGPHLAFFLHDEVIVHTPTPLAAEVATAVREAAASAGRLLFGTFPVDFPLEVEVVTSYGATG